jgi:hypothetical protein
MDRLLKPVADAPPEGWLRLLAPPKLTFRSANEATLKFLRRIYVEVVDHDRPCTIDMSRVKSMSFGSALALVAEIDRAQELRPGRIVRGLLPKDFAVRKILHQVGFVAATVSSPSAAPTGPGQLLKMRTGTAEDVRDLEWLDEFLRGIFPIELMSDFVRGRLKGAVKEALLNVVEHAYDPAIPRDDQCLSNRWWMCGRADKVHGCYFVVYDLGVGIPVTVPRSTADAVREAYGDLDAQSRRFDHELIKAAVTHGHSRTEKQGRGRGLPEMRRLVDRVGEGMLWITSGSGHYMYGRGDQEIDRGFSMNRRLHGTLVVWRFKVTKALEDDGAADG